MTITHHPAPESLMSCSAGSMPEAFAAVMASHIAMCPHCRKELAVLQEIGVALFEGLAPAPVQRGAPVIAMRGEEAEHGQEKKHAVIEGDVPAPLVDAIGPSLEAIEWTRVAPGIWQHKIALSHEGDGALRLIKVDPGRSLPEHSHRGSELTLVLKGSFKDGSGCYRAGDVAEAGMTVEHAPVVDPVKGCICLVATCGKLRFKSALARIIQPLTGF